MLTSKYLRGLPLIFVLLTAEVFPFQLPVETASSQIQGKILDPSLAPVEGAKITAIATNRSFSSTAVADQNGQFSFRLEPGDYTLKITARGFSEYSNIVTVKFTDAEPLKIVLEVAPSHDTIVVIDSANYQVSTTRSATKTSTALQDVPQSITVVTQDQIKDQLMMSIGDVVRYVPGITSIQGENNRDQLVIRGNNTSADFFVNGVRDDVQYYRDLYNLDRIEALKGPNGMIFGRGGAGGVINRVTKEAGFTSLREFTLQGGSFGNKRFAADIDQPFNSKVAFRLNGVYENSDTFRDFVDLERYGVAPTLTIAASDKTKIRFDYEHFRDTRIADRGIPSFRGTPADIDISTFFGNPDDSHVRARVNLGSATIEHQAGALNIRNHTLVGDYDRKYQNYVPGAVTADRTQVALSGYNNATQRRNVFNQMDMTYSVRTGRIRHTLVGGTEIGHQVTDNFRNTGYFDNAVSSILVPFANPAINTPVVYRQSTTDADNHVRTRVAAIYVQDQIAPARRIQLVAGVRLNRFDLRYHNNRNQDNLRRIDTFVAPRVGIVIKPITALSIYGNYSVSYLPSSGDQFSSLTAITQQVKPEKFDNYELGAKLDVRRKLSLTTAVYRLDRTNTRATDPNDPTRILQTGSQRTNGYEFALNGSLTRAWKVAGGYAYQHAFVTSATTAALAGMEVAQVPRHTLSLWNNYQLLSRLGLGLGVLHRSDMYAAIDNAVTLPGYTRTDAALYYSLTERWRLQGNIENMFNRRYYLNADSNNNISPGSSRAVRIALIARF